MSDSLSKEQLSLLYSQLFPFIQQSSTPYHAVKNIEQLFSAHNFQELKEENAWPSPLCGRYYIKRDGLLLAFVIDPLYSPAEYGWRVLGAHTDSPALRVRPQPHLESEGLFQLGVEIYGGPILSTWFDRELSIAGKICYTTPQQELKEALVDLQKPCALIPNLAIHFNREINEKRSINRHTELNPILLSTTGKEKTSLEKIIKEEMARQNIEIDQLLSHDLRFYDPLPPQLVGLDLDFILGSRLDNLLSCFAIASALTKANSPYPQMALFFDHEEVGSSSETGAETALTLRLLNRILNSQEDLSRSLSKSLCLSLDNAHGVHPNYLEAYDANHRPHLNGGPVIKINTNQRYATTPVTEAIFQHLCHQKGLPCQKITVRGDRPCGTTLGPITSTNLGMAALDIGLPTWAMHSLRETAGSQDIFTLMAILDPFLHTPGPMLRY